MIKQIIYEGFLMIYYLSQPTSIKPLRIFEISDKQNLEIRAFGTKNLPKPAPRSLLITTIMTTLLTSKEVTFEVALKEFKIL